MAILNKNKGWTWFLSKSLRSWDVMSLSLTARQLGARGVRLTVISQTGFFPGGFPDVISWRSLDGWERGLTVAMRGRMWHLWGQPPGWWPLVRSRAATVHSFRDKDGEWKGHPAVFAGTGTLFDGNAWLPAFDRELSWGSPGDEKGDPVALVVFPVPMVRPDRDIMDLIRQGLGVPAVRLSDQTGALPGAGGTLDESDVVRFLSGHSGILILPAVDFSLGLLAGFASLYGIPTVAPWSPMLDDLLGHGGYISPKKGHESDLASEAMGEPGRLAAAGARHRLTESFTPELSAQSLLSVYRTVTGPAE